VLIEKVGAVLGWWPTFLISGESTMKSQIALVLVRITLNAQTVAFSLHIGDKRQYEFKPMLRPDYPCPSARIVSDTLIRGKV
jgi:hypothetical protein